VACRFLSVIGVEIGRPDMDDIVDRLRKSGERPYCYCALFKGYAAEALEAADEIERLRRALLIAAGKLSTTDAYAMLPPDAVHEGLLALADKDAT
jgi:hypothetical protein